MARILRNFFRRNISFLVILYIIPSVTGNFAFEAFEPLRDLREEAEEERVPAGISGIADVYFPDTADEHAIITRMESPRFIPARIAFRPVFAAAAARGREAFFHSPFSAGNDTRPANLKNTILLKLLL
jgi:hypothetical protein